MRLAAALSSILLMVFFHSVGNAASQDIYRIYFDADQTAGSSSADAMFLGVKAAFAQNGNRLGDRKVELVRLDHRGNPKRSFLNIKKSLKDEAGLAVFGGVHSPPYISYRDQINDAGAVMLLPWSAGAPITRSGTKTNGFFRVSVDDAKAGGFLASQVLADEACNDVMFLIWDSGWGRSNQPRLEQTFENAGRSKPVSILFNTGLGPEEAREIVDEITKQNPDCAIIVGNMLEEALLLNELHAAGVQLKVFSHWGILLGDFSVEVPAVVRNDLQFRFLQTCALEREAAGNKTLKALFADPPIAELEGKKRLADIPSAVGFVNAYDLASILIKAGEALPEGGEIEDHRKALIAALETINQPVDGILKRYDPPFSQYAHDAPDAREALGADDLCMAQFDDQGHVVSIGSGS